MEEFIHKGEDKRLDCCFGEQPFFANFGRREIGDLIRAKKILVNEKAVKPGYRVSEGDRISYDEKTAKPENVLLANGALDLPLIFENEDLLVFNKPAGIQVHPDKKNQTDTLVNFVVAHYPQLRTVHDGSPEAFWRPGIVHRLDRDTSGVIVLAKNSKTLLALKQKFKEREMSKKYLAIVHGCLELQSGEITKPLARATNYRRQVVAGKKTKTKVREAKTNYTVLEKLGANRSLLAVWPKTGRMHQIRVHLASIGHPIVGDKLYCPKNVSPCFEAKRQMLHAESLKFSLFGQEYEFIAELPEDFSQFLRREK